jgi:archaellum component FlaC
VAFTVTDFDDFMAVLRAKPEWQAELRHLLVGEELATINRSIDRLDETVRRLEASIVALADWSKEMFERMDRRLSTIESDLGTLKADVGGLKRWS